MMPKQLTEIEDAVGKTIAKVAEVGGDWVGILFSDGDYLCLQSDSDGTYDVIGLEEPPNAEQMLAIGLVTQEEIDIDKAVSYASWKRKCEENEREYFLRLKAKFEPGGPR